MLGLCDRVGSELEGKLKRDGGAATQNKVPCALAIKRFRNEVKPTLEQLLETTPGSTETHLRAREAVARCLATIASAITWTDDFVFSEKLYAEALALADGTMATGLISNALREISESASLQRFRGKRIESAPSLFTFNGIGTTLYGRADPDAQTGSYVATLYFVILMVPIFPIARYRVIEQPGRRFQFLGQQPFRPMDRWWLGLALATTVLLVLWPVVKAQSGHVGPMAGSDNAAPSAGYDVAPVSDAGNPTPGASSSAPGAGADANAPVTAPLPTQPPAADGSAGSGSGLGSLIEVGRARMADIDTQLTALKSQIDPLDRSMDELKNEIDALQTQRNEGEQVDDSDYNSKVDEYNDMLARRRNITTEFNGLVDEHNTLLESDRAMVARYNAGER